MDAEAAGAFYDRSYFHGGDYADYESSRLFLQRNFDVFARRMRRIHRGRRLLEVGCAYGYFLDIVQRDWDVEGIDISEDAIRSARHRFGERVRCGDLLSQPLRSSAYDWVVAWDTIEHVDEPRAYVQRVGELLTPGGYVALTTGDVSSLVARLRSRRWRLLTPPSHLTFFSRTGMRRMLNDAGFEDIRISTTGYRRSLDFVFYRLLGGHRCRRIMAASPSLHRLLQDWGFYLNLFDVMFVTARKPLPAGSP